MSQEAYSNLKTIWHSERMDMLRNGRLPAPLQVHFIISDLCNQDCHFCSYRMSGGISTEQFAEGGNKNPNRMIPHEKCIELLDDFKEVGIKAVQFTGGGEPTVHPQHMEIFQHALDLGLECALVTNGALFRKGWEEVLPKFKWVRVSVDAADPEQYARVRNVKPTIYARVLMNVAALAEEIKRQGTDCLLGVGYVVTKENRHGLVEACETFRDMGVPYVRLSAMFSTEGAKYYSGIYEEIKGDIWAAKQLETDGFKVVDLFGDRLSDLDQGAPDYSFCGYQQLCTYVGGNLKVYRCCSTSYTAHGEIGDLRDQRFREWFHSLERMEKIRNFDAHSCNVCQFNNKNKAINYMLDEEPLHVNFV